MTRDGQADAMWMAEMETSSTVSRGFGHTPEEAVAALAARWRMDWAPMSGAEAGLPLVLREEIRVCEFAMGQGYVKGSTGVLWHPREISGADPRFDEVFAGERRGPAFR